MRWLHRCSRSATSLILSSFRLNSVFAPKNSLLGLQKFTVSLRREFSCKPLNSLPDWARKIVQGAGIDKIPC